MKKICPLCKTENEEDARFCKECNEPLYDIKAEEKRIKNIRKQKEVKMKWPNISQDFILSLFLLFCLIVLFIIGDYQDRRAVIYSVIAFVVFLFFPDLFL